MAVCDYHPDRAGVGVCMRCQAVICSACCTRVDEVNHCHACLKALASRALPQGKSSAPTAVLLLAGSCLLFFGILLLARGSLVP